ncbi:cytochrome c peroxidase [Oryzomicrobium sp.]|uniref:cytochrome-c peroxidase n=1 Tax=Oryzomicrobium sp. TaxID=1911578 RepID=UPI0025DA4559|nr:cytochrome c peroxidase [Oryzomicrobium sp.]MCE1241809.1 cytochrome-c peroxidase [Oryzomicrobium sp.]
MKTHARTHAIHGLRAACLAAALSAAPTALPAPAAPDCRTANGWDAACLRRLYAAPAAAWPAPEVEAGVAWQELGPVPAVAPTPASNPGTPARVELGRRLFFDPRLSAKGELSCAGCHRPEKAFTDGKPLAVGEDKLMGRRRTPPLLAAPFAPRLFWDGRAGSLEEQVVGPIANPVEMNHPLPRAVARIKGLDEYRAPWRAAFGTAGPDEATLAQALAAFVRTLRPEATAFDRFLAGDAAALSDGALTGLHLFRTKAGCLNCHYGPLLTDHGFHDIGLSFYGRRNQDLGRFEVTRNKADLGAFRTPSLRNVARAGPWMHNGIFPDLKGLLRMYNAGMGNLTPKETATADPYRPRKSPLIRARQLDEAEIDALHAFLEAL